MFVAGYRRKTNGLLQFENHDSKYTNRIKCKSRTDIRTHIFFLIVHRFLVVHPDKTFYRMVLSDSHLTTLDLPVYTLKFQNTNIVYIYKKKSIFVVSDVNVVLQGERKRLEDQKHGNILSRYQELSSHRWERSFGTQLLTMEARKVMIIFTNFFFKSYIRLSIHVKSQNV